MIVKLIEQFGNIERVADISSICYGHDKAKNPRKLFRHLIDRGHTSTMEHIVFTFYVEGISRACLSQLVRHRLASYTVRSQRYCKEIRSSYTMPESMDTRVDVEKFMDYVFDFYEQLLEDGIKPEDARYILPNAVDTGLYLTINLRSLMNLLQLRTNQAAQEEIRKLAYNMLKEIKANDNELGEEIERWLK